MKKRIAADLTPAEVRAINDHRGLQLDIAAEYGITQGLVSAIKQGRVRKDVRRGAGFRRPRGHIRGKLYAARHLSRKDILAIWASYERTHRLAQRYGVSRVIVQEIRSGRRAVEITGGPGGTSPRGPEPKYTNTSFKRN